MAMFAGAACILIFSLNANHATAAIVLPATSGFNMAQSVAWVAVSSIIYTSQPKSLFFLYQPVANTTSLIFVFQINCLTVELFPTRIRATVRACVTLYVHKIENYFQTSNVLILKAGGLVSAAGRLGAIAAQFVNGELLGTEPYHALLSQTITALLNTTLPFPTIFPI